MFIILSVLHISLFISLSFHLLFSCFIIISVYHLSPSHSNFISLLFYPLFSCSFILSRISLFSSLFRFHLPLSCLIIQSVYHNYNSLSPLEPHPFFSCLSFLLFIITLPLTLFRFHIFFSCFIFFLFIISLYHSFCVSYISLSLPSSLLVFGHYFCFSSLFRFHLLFSCFIIISIYHISLSSFSSLFRSLPSSILMFGYSKSPYD